MNDDIRGSSHIRPEDRRSSHARSMHVPATSSSAATGEARPLEPPNAYPWQSTVNGDGSLDQSQSSDSSKRRSSQSPSAQGSGSQTSLTTVTSEPSSTANGTSAQHAAKDIPLQISAGTTAFQSQGPHGLSSVVENGIEDTQHAGHKSVGLSELHDRPLSKASSQSPSKGRSAELTQGHKRTASGDIKPTTETKELHNPARRQRSTSIDSSRGNRVAELSAHLRSRLSYAAARVERNRQRDGHAQIPLRFVHDDSPTPRASPMKQTHDCHQIPNDGSPRSTITSIPNSSSSFPASSDPNQFSPGTSPDGLPFGRSSQPSSQSTSPTKLAQIPKLAPPADIISSGPSDRRRRPNPNESPHRPRYPPNPGHRRYHSQQEFGASKLLVPGTPPLRPNMQPTSTPSAAYNDYSKPRTHSQSTSMEQDAIETLLFMSSPENSGYHPSPQIRPDSIPKSIAPPVTFSPRENGSQSQRSNVNGQGGPPAGLPRRVIGLEAHAGDEIDRMLDQMDSDSEDERHFS